MKFTGYEAGAIEGLVASSPFLSWLYAIGSVQGVSNLIGLIELAIAGALALGPWNRKAAIVMEHLIQASDVAHTMQHWQVYQKWNSMLFHEMYRAFQEGRSDKDPSIKWYESELGFFDHYVIPLAKKLKQCGVFGVSSDEYLNYALENRREWSNKGKGIVEEMKDVACKDLSDTPRTSVATSDEMQ